MEHRNFRAQFIPLQNGLLPALLCLFSCCALFQLQAQREPEVRRAEPVTRPVTEPPTAPAVPFDPIERPQVPVAPATPPPENPGDGSGEIRISPQSGTTVAPDKTQFDIANGFYAREMFDVAGTEYEKYVREFPSGSDRQAALFRLAECYRIQKRAKEARDVYESVLIEFQQGEFVGNTAYRLGDIYYLDKNFKGAVPMFQKAASLAKDPKIILAARYNEARSLEMLGKRNETLQVYLEIVKMPGKNPYREASRLALASRFTELGRPADAMAQFEALAKEAESAELRAESAIRAAALATQLEQPEKAAALYAAAAQVEEGGKWKGIGVVGQLQALYEAKKFKQLVSTFNESQASIPPEAMPAALILVGNSQRQLEQFDGAVKIFERIIREFPDSKEKGEAAFQKLVCLYEQKSPDLVKEIDRFLASNPESEQTNQARLLKAELLFNEDKFAEAGPLYLQLATSNMDPKFRAEAVFKLGWCYAQVQNYEKAIEAYTLFIGDFRLHALLPAAYAQRGVAFQKMKNYDRALTDFDTIILNHPKSKERELALQQKALIYGQKNDNAQMMAAFEILLRDYPKSSAAGQALYWVGWGEFEQKRYEKALEPFSKSRQADKEYYARATLRIILCHYYLENQAELGKEIDAYVAAKAMPPVPSEVAGWLGIKLLADSKTPDAVKYLSIAAEGMASPDVYLALGRAQLDMSNWKEAVAALNSYLKTATDPVARARGLLALGEAQVGMKDAAAAKKSAEQILTLQPEGRLNAEGRLLKAEAEFAEGRFEEAAKSFSGVAFLFDDVAITPRALKSAADAYKKAGKPAESQKLMDELKQKYPEYASPNNQPGQ